MDEETLIIRYRNGDIAAGASLVSLNEALVRAIFSRHYKSNTAAEDDFMQEGRLGVLEACKRYNPAKASQFGYYKSIWIRKKMSLLYKKESKFLSRKRTQSEIVRHAPQPTPTQGMRHDIAFLLDYDNVSDILPKKDHAKLVHAALQFKTTKDSGIYRQIETCR